MSTGCRCRITRPRALCVRLEARRRSLPRRRGCAATRCSTCLRSRDARGSWERRRARLQCSLATGPSDAATGSSVWSRGLTWTASSPVSSRLASCEACATARNASSATAPTATKSRSRASSGGRCCRPTRPSKWTRRRRCRSSLATCSCSRSLPRGARGSRSRLTARASRPLYPSRATRTATTLPRAATLRCSSIEAAPRTMAR